MESHLLKDWLTVNAFTYVKYKYVYFKSKLKIKIKFELILVNHLPIFYPSIVIHRSILVWKLLTLCRSIHT